MPEVKAVVKARWDILSQGILAQSEIKALAYALSDPLRMNAPYVPFNVSAALRNQQKWNREGFTTPNALLQAIEGKRNKINEGFLFAPHVQQVELLGLKSSDYYQLSYLQQCQVIQDIGAIIQIFNTDELFLKYYPGLFDDKRYDDSQVSKQQAYFMYIATQLYWRLFCCRLW